MSLGELSTLDRTGDTRIRWDSTKPDEVAVARAAFDELTRKGYMAYKTKKDAELRGDQIRVFDSRAERIVMVPQLVGG